MKRTVEDIDIFEKRVLLRVDFNVPLDNSGNILDPSRILAELPTIKYLLSKNAKVIICSHLGRPKGEFNQQLSMVNIAKYLIKLLNCKIRFSPEAIGDKVKKLIDEMNFGEVLVLENIRFYKEEEENSPLFASKLAELADVYVNDAFGTAHRKHASTYEVAKLLPNAVGFLMGKEINTIVSVLDNPQRPFVAIIGGAKISDKLNIIHNLIKKCDTILIGGAMSYTFLKAQGVDIGKSVYEESCIESAKNILEDAKQIGTKVLLPIDHICASLFSPNAQAVKVKQCAIQDNLQGLDIGPKTIKMYKNEIKSANTIIWNGPMGVFEFANFAKGTYEIAKCVAKNKGKTIVGGGDSISAINKLKLNQKIYHISTGGGASLKLIAGECLPGVDVIADK